MNNLFAKSQDGFPIVPAYAVDETHIYFKCPYSRRLTYHLHGSCGDLTNRLTHRGSHIQEGELAKGYYLDINNETIRGEMRNKRILKRSINKLNTLWDKQQMEKDQKFLDALGANGATGK